MTAKYQVFVSSTYDDLRDAREQIIKATLEMGHIPVGMEMFSAADEQQWKVISKQIDQSDYYAVVVAHRYGSVSGEISYTEKEYDYAVQQGIPVVAFIIADEAQWQFTHVDEDSEKTASLRRFKEKLRRKPVGFWRSAEDLHSKFSIALMKLINTNPRPGWVRANEVAGPEVITEMSRLSTENAALRARLLEAERTVASEHATMIVRTIQALRANMRLIPIGFDSTTNWDESHSMTLYSIFTALAPVSQVEIAVDEAAVILAVSAVTAVSRDQKNVDSLRYEWPVPRDILGRILSDLMVLGLIVPSQRKHSVKDVREYWSLAPLGWEVYSTIRLEALEQGEAELQPPTTS